MVRMGWIDLVTSRTHLFFQPHPNPTSTISSPCSQKSYLKEEGVTMRRFPKDAKEKKKEQTKCFGEIGTHCCMMWIVKND